MLRQKRIPFPRPPFYDGYIEIDEVALFLTVLEKGFAEVCAFSCQFNTDNPYGANQVPPGYSTASGYISFEDVITKVLRKYRPELDLSPERLRLCSPDLISFPMDPGHNYYGSGGTGSSYASLDSCACDKINSAYCEYLNKKNLNQIDSRTLFATYFNEKYSTSDRKIGLSALELDNILCCCNKSTGSFTGLTGGNFIATKNPIQLGYEIDGVNKNLVFTKAVQQPTGDLVISGIEFKDINPKATPNAFSITKTDAFGNPLFHQSYGVADAVTGVNQEGFSVSLNSHSNQISALHYLPRSEQFLLARFNGEGQPTWSKTYGNFYTNDRMKGNAMEVERGSGDYLIGGSYLASGARQAGVFRLDSTGNTVWAKRYDLPQSRFSYIGGVVSDGNQGMFAVGGSDSAQTWQGLIYHLDAAGSVLWSKKIALPDTSIRLTTLKREGNNRYVALGVQEDQHTGAHSINLIRFTESGQVLQAKTLALTTDHAIVDAELNADLVLTASNQWTITGGYAERDSLHRGFSIQTDTSLSVFTASTIKSEGEDVHFSSVTALGGNRYAYVGSTVQGTTKAEGLLSYASGDRQPGQESLNLRVNTLSTGTIINIPVETITTTSVVLVGTNHDLTVSNKPTGLPVTKIKKYVPQKDVNCPWVPEVLRCEKCLTCKEITEKLITFQQKYFGGCDHCTGLEWLILEKYQTEEETPENRLVKNFTDEEYYTLLQNYLNREFGFNLRYQDYLDYLFLGKNGEPCSYECLVCDFCQDPQRRNTEPWATLCRTYIEVDGEGDEPSTRCQRNCGTNCLPLCPKKKNPPHEMQDSLLCNRPMFRNMEEPCPCVKLGENPCYTGSCADENRVQDKCCIAAVANKARASAKMKYEQYLAEIQNQLRAKYIQECMAKLNKSVLEQHPESSSLNYPLAEYHYTLYYYDQAGNLVRTVPPKAVQLLDLPIPPNSKYEVSAFCTTLMNWRNHQELDICGSPPCTLYNRYAGFITSAFVPNHARENDNDSEKLTTEYRYNSLRNMMAKRTPDDGVTRFYYDLMGKPILTQTARQFKEPFRYSFTNYDALDRPIASGEWLVPASQPQRLKENFSETLFANVEVLYEDLVQYARHSSNHPLPNQTTSNWVRDELVKATDVNVRDNASRIRDLVETFYSDRIDENLAAALSSEVGWENPENNDALKFQLRNRVAFVRTSERPQVRRSDQSYHYQYDIHGNVKQLFSQQYNEETGHLFRKVEQDYDLIANKVNTMIFQAGALDQYIHRYLYDADNRIRVAQTSTDGFNYQREAAYSYYKHGPLARTELGDANVQGCDYTYTLAGWIKGVNSTMLSTEKDPSKDHSQTFNANFAPDVYGYSLTYYDFTNLQSGQFRDYDAIGNHWQASPGIERNNIWQVFADRSPTGDYRNHFDVRPINGSNVLSQTRNLFNGNIARMTTGILPFMNQNGPDSWSPQATVYRYDQLNRLAGMQAYSNAVSSGNEGLWVWQGIGAGTNTYKESFTYDPNGNIKTAQRWDQGQMLLDDLSYAYANNDNRLKHIDDAENSNPYTKDLKDQEEDNYRYDDVGNLIADKKEGIVHIDWRADGKVRRVLKKKSVPNEVGPPTEVYTTLRFRYDAMGNRIEKSVYEGDKVSTTMYARDASGNVLATYKLKDKPMEEGQVAETLTKATPEEWLQTVYAHFSPSNGLTASEFRSQLLAKIPVIHEQESKLDEIMGYLRLGNYLQAKFSLAGLKNPENVNQTDYGLWMFGLVLEDWIRANGKETVFQNIPLYSRTVQRQYIRTEAHIYGSSRLGMDTKEEILATVATAQAWNPFTNCVMYLHSTTTTAVARRTPSSPTIIERGNKRYELSNHLGNVLAVITDKLLPNTTYDPNLLDNRSGTLNHLFTADVVSATDYYAFGMVMPGRSFEVAGAYRYGFNGKEKDSEWENGGATYDYGFRIYDPRIARFLSVDPLNPKFPWYTPYQFAGNKPITFIDLDGLEEKKPDSKDREVYEYGLEFLGALGDPFVRVGSSLASSFTKGGIGIWKIAQGESGFHADGFEPWSLKYDSKNGLRFEHFDPNSKVEQLELIQSTFKVAASSVPIKYVQKIDGKDVFYTTTVKVIDKGLEMIPAKILNIPTNSLKNYALSSAIKKPIVELFNSATDMLSGTTNSSSTTTTTNSNAVKSSQSNLVITIKKGDTLSKLANTYNTTVAKLAKDNNIADPNKINEGATLKVTR